MNLVTSNNAKLKKSESAAQDVISAGVSMAQHTLAGTKTVCPYAEKARCAPTCLATYGRYAMQNSSDSRKEKTRLFYEDRAAFFAILFDDLHKVAAKARRQKKSLYVRLNLLSDIRYEIFDKNGGYVSRTKEQSIIEYFYDVEFFDYTKIPNRNTPKNYSLYWSYSRVDGYRQFFDEAMEHYGRVAVVFQHDRDLPLTFNGYRVVDGDGTDFHFLQEKPVIIGLKAKGKLRKGDHDMVVYRDLDNLHVEVR